MLPWHHSINADLSFQTIAELLHRAEQLKISPLQVVERIVDGNIPDIKPPVKKKLCNFVGVIRDMRRFANEVGFQSSYAVVTSSDLCCHI